VVSFRGLRRGVCRMDVGVVNLLKRRTRHLGMEELNN
jgi:hypothetical protein